MRGLYLALALGACAFSSAYPFFEEGEGVAALGEGGAYVLFESGERKDVFYQRAGAGYELASTVKGDAPLHVVFVPLEDTPQEDYVLQITPSPGEDARAYAFMWRADAEWIIATAPNVFAADSAGRALLTEFCAERPHGECQFSRREDLLAFYHRAIWPAFVSGGVRPEHYISQGEAVSEPSRMEK